jgi:hypothetical protein
MCEGRMKKDLVKIIVLYLIDQLQDNGSPISTIRIIKYLYLLDLEYYNGHFKTFTGINWIRYTYGPYFFAWPNIVNEIGYRLSVEEIKTDRGDGFTYRVDEPYRIDDKVPFGVQKMIDRIVKKWGDEDLEEILNHVYASLPVEESKLNEEIDFTIETDHLLLEKAVEDAESFDTLSEFYEEIMAD